mmetsp:Transcript_98086/g.245797  ORF Transcript_98086/g.245797 Transcript_98086/m.245797 type:complete len:255 (+) Transcript_98086:460-1224(+)
MPLQVLDEIQDLAALDDQLAVKHELNKPGLSAEYVALPRQFVQQELLPLLVHRQSQLGKILDDVETTLVLLDLPLGVEEDHVVQRNRGAQLEDLFEGTLVGDTRGESELEIDALLGVVLRVVLQKLPAVLLLVAFGQVLLQELTVVLRPLLDWQLCDCGLIGGQGLDNACHLTLALCGTRRDGPLEASKPREHLLQLLPLDVPAQVCDHIFGIVVRDRCSPTCADTLGAIHKAHGDDRAVPTWLNLHAILVEVL